MLFQLSSILSLFALCAFAEIVPTSPDGNTVVTVGQDIKALWSSDTTGQWNNVEIQLMTGDNYQMVPLATLATDIDGTSTTGLNIPCPDVTPYSKIYFLQFTMAGNVSSATWTTRFTIAGADGSTVTPSNTTTYNGTPVQWGTGALVGQAPNVITGSSNSTSNTTTASTSSTSAAGFVTVTSAEPISTSTSAAAQSSSQSSASSMSASASRASTAPASSSGAAFKKSTVGMGAIILGLAGFVAL